MKDRFIILIFAVLVLVVFFTLNKTPVGVQEKPEIFNCVPEEYPVEEQKCVDNFIHVQRYRCDTGTGKWVVGDWIKTEVKCGLTTTSQFFDDFTNKEESLIKWNLESSSLEFLTRYSCPDNICYSFENSEIFLYRSFPIILEKTFSNVKSIKTKQRSDYGQVSFNFLKGGHEYQIGVFFINNEWFFRVIDYTTSSYNRMSIIHTTDKILKIDFTQNKAYYNDYVIDYSFAEGDITRFWIDGNTASDWVDYVVIE